MAVTPRSDGLIDGTISGGGSIELSLDNGSPKKIELLEHPVVENKTPLIPTNPTKPSKGARNKLTNIPPNITRAVAKSLSMS